METVIRLQDARLPGLPPDPATGLSWTIRSGERWALWGPNGAGKSTLLAVLAGDRAPADGLVRRPPGLVVARVPQEPRVPAAATLADAVHRALGVLRHAEAAVREEERRLARGEGDLARLGALHEAFERAGGWRAPARLERELAQLLPGRDRSTPAAALSAGERRRLALAIALAGTPELLLLDEPTNGLDVEARRWLAERLARDAATLVVASHDRALLSAVSTHSARLAAGRLEPVALPFDRDREQRGIARRRARRRAREARAEGERLARAAERARGWGSRGAAASMERRARALLADGAAVAEDDERHEATWTLADGTAARGPLLRADHLSAEPFHDLSLVLEAGAKVALLGPNGSGKSTLLDLLAGARASARADAEVWVRPRVRVHHWDARRRGLSDEPIGAQLERWVREPRAASLLSAAALPREAWRRAPDALSGGQRARAAVALAIAREPDLLLLDEPETDLDIVGLELLESALAEARLTVLLATHDLRLAEGVCEEAWSLEEGGLVAWRGGVEGFTARRRRREPLVVPPPAPRAPEPPDEEARLERLEDEAAAAERRLEDPLRLGERERLRLELRLERLEEERMEAYDARLAPPAPRFAARVPVAASGAPAVLLEADLASAPATGPLAFRALWPALPRVAVREGIAHLQLPDPPGAVWLPWARSAALRACAQVVFTALYPRAIQTPARAGEAPPAPWLALDADWWVLPREAWEASEGFAPPPPARLGPDASR